MIDPNNITKYDRTDKELLEFWLFCILVAGKKSSWAANKVAELDRIFGIEVLFQLDKVLIKNMLMLCSAGQYERISNAIHESKSIDLRKAGFLELMQIKGIGRKSASFFLLHSREGWEGVVLDTHLLAFLRDNGVPAPKSTPQDAKKYKYLETELYRLFKKKFPNKTLAEADLTVWKAYSGKNKLALEQNAELI
jgi:thermostable 8-oxoguanine DNA glycosylase